jgi:2-polyprenyl-3-methyl-5-hydroxy-6-metoxy-1,4-benzoquinol methylase
VDDNNFYQHINYLSYWKKELDDNAINRNVLSVLLKHNNKFSRSLDIGTGTGVQIRRNIELSLYDKTSEIVGIDINENLLQSSITVYEEWAKSNNYNMIIFDDEEAIYKFELSNSANKYNIELYCESVYDLNQEKYGSFDFVTGLSLLEHTEIGKTLHAIYIILKKGGMLYLPSNYDQYSVFGPTDLKIMQTEQNLMQLFNYIAIDNQHRGGVTIGNSSCGSLLPGYCVDAGFEVIGYGSSDWIILADRIVSQSQNVKSALSFFVDSFSSVFKSSDLLARKKFNVTSEDIDFWCDLRKNQFENGELYYSCIQKDILCKK